VSLKGANLFASQNASRPARRAPISRKRALRLTLTGASLSEPRSRGGNLSADMRNQSMGLMRAVLKSANLERLNARGAPTCLASIWNLLHWWAPTLTGAFLKNAQLGGADLTGVTGHSTHDFDGAIFVISEADPLQSASTGKKFERRKSRSSDQGMTRPAFT